jgi:hypothetical protein
MFHAVMNFRVLADGDLILIPVLLLSVSGNNGINKPKIVQSNGVSHGLM